MWLIQTPIEGLVLPTDSDGHLSLGGHVPAWHHIVRGRGRGRDANGAEARLSACDLEWEMRPWYEAAGKIYFRGAGGAYDALLERVRAQRARPLTRALFPEAGRRRVDGIVQLTIIVPPTLFAHYESMVRLAMSLPAGTAVFTMPVPLVDNDSDSDQEERHLLSPGHTAYVSGCELVVSRATAVAFSVEQLGHDQRAPAVSPAAVAHLEDDGYADWFHFRRVDDRVNDRVNDRADDVRER